MMRNGLRRGEVAALMTALLVVLSACNASSSPSPSGSGAGAAASAAPASATGQFCSGVNLVFFPGGTQGGGFETVVYNGAKAAEAAFGPKIVYQWSDWDPNKMITQFQQAMATKPDGIAVMGHPGDAAFDPLIKQAMDQDILVTVMNTELPKAESAYATKGLGYVGAVLHDAGAALANEAIARGGLKSGDRAFVWGLEAQAGRGERTKGIHETLQTAGLTVDYLEIDDATNKDPANGTATFTGYVSAHPDVKAMFIDHGNLTSTIPTYMKAANLTAGKVYMAGFDASAGDHPGHQGRLHQPGHRPAAVPPGLPGRRAAVPHQEVRLQRPVRQHGRRLHRQVERRQRRLARAAADPLVAGPSGPTTSGQADGRDSARQPASPAVPRLELRGISKSFGGVHVLEDIDLRLGASEVVGLLGDNGAGKSTLIKIITGVHQPDRGEILFGGERVDGLTVQRARSLGVETVFQERALADAAVAVAEHLHGPAHQPTASASCGSARCAAATAELMGESMGFTSAVLTPDTSVHGLSGGERQGLAIVRALHFQADIIILDEPTMGLSLKETEKLLHFVDGIRGAGKSAIFIDHNIFHVYSVADRIVVLDRGRVAGEFPTSRYSLDELMDIMREVASTGAYTEAERYRGDASGHAAGGLA